VLAPVGLKMDKRVGAFSEVSLEDLEKNGSNAACPNKNLSRRKEDRKSWEKSFPTILKTLQTFGNSILDPFPTKINSLESRP
jgi:hypothetical protein